VSDATSERKEGACVVFGASGGIGSALCGRLSESGRPLVLVGRDEEKVAALADPLGALSIEADATSFADAQRVLRDMAARFGAVGGGDVCGATVAVQRGGAGAHADDAADHGERAVAEGVGSWVTGQVFGIDGG